VSELVCHIKRVKGSTERNITPMFTKLTTKAEFKDVWLPILLVEIRNAKPFCQNRKCYESSSLFHDAGLKGGQIGN